MRRCLPAVIAFCLLAASTPLAANSQKKVIVLGFDGVDAGLFEKFLSEGHLPNLQKLRNRGSYLPLATTNPAQSPVAWAAITTGSWPGKTNIYDFLEVERPPGGPPYPTLESMTSEGSQRALDNPNVRRMLTKRAIWVALAAAGLCAVLKILRVRWGYALGISIVLGLATLAVGYVLVRRYLPELVPMAVNNRRGTPVWAVTARQGVRTTVLEAPVTFPPDRVDGARILSGLGVPDVAKTWGFWSFFTSDPDADRDPDTGGWIYPLRPKGRSATAFLHGPEDLYGKDRAAQLVEKSRTAKTRSEQVPYDKELEDLVARRIDSTQEMLHALDLAEDFKDNEVQALETTRRQIMIASTGEAVRLMSYPQIYEAIRFDVDPAASTLTATVQGRTTTVKLGTWSDWVTIEYVMNPMLRVRGMTKLYLQKIEPLLEIVATPIQFHPGDVPPIIDLTYPHAYAADLCEEVGLFDTLGWATLTNPHKDGRLDEDGFLENVHGVYETVRELSLNELAKRDWGFFFTMFAVTDRLQHMMFRMIDPKSPTHDPAKAAKYGDEILKIYQDMDRFVGEVADAYLDDDTQLLVISDHGFRSFRRGVNLNRWLASEGFMVGTNLERHQSVATLTQKSAGFENVEWDKTRAYALGLGGIYINVKGREGLGIVDLKDYVVTCDEIAAKLRTLRDDDGTPVVKEVYKRGDIYHGDHLDRAPDLVVGFHEGYRVSWQTTLGGAPPKIIEDNLEPWSGDHCSVDPSLVPGILVSNRRLSASSASVVDVAPTVCAFLGIEPDPKWDGRALLDGSVARKQ